jgi:hypothetical protein
LQQVLEMLVFSNLQCLHARMEMAAANPFIVDPILPTPCGNACGHCLSSSSNSFKRVSRSGLTSVLVGVFISPPPSSALTLHEDLPSAIRSFKLANDLLYKSKAKGMPALADIKGIVLQLVAASIIKAYHTEDNNAIFACLNVDSNSVPLLYSDSVWSRIATTPQ